MKPIKSPYRVPFEGKFRLARCPHTPPDDAPSKRKLEKRLEERIVDIERWQRRLYAADRNALLLVFQAMDAAGKDGTIRAVLSGVNPAGCQVASFKQPSTEELDHDFLWRIVKALPTRGRIGVFNRSHYEEVLVVRVHPEYLGAQRIEVPDDPMELWTQRYEAIRSWEEHLARSGTVILKFFLNVSHEEQRRRFLSRLDEPEKNWKFSVGDVAERARWDDYMAAYEDALAATSRPWAPWYAIPADDKRYMRCTVATLVRDALERIAPEYPEVNPDDAARFDEMRALLEGD